MAIALYDFDLLQPDDLSGLTAALDRLDLSRLRRMLLLLRVSGEYEDGSRERARAAVKALLNRKNLMEQTEFVTVVGCDGASTPCGYAFVDLNEDESADGTKRLALGLSRMLPCADDIIGTLDLARLVKVATEQAMNDAGLAKDEVEVAIVNVPQPESDVARRARRGRAAAALGAGAALDEIRLEDLNESDIVDNAGHYARRVQTFAGPGIDQVGVAVIGNRRGAGGGLFACHALTNDLLDTSSIKRMLLNAGVRIDPLGQMQCEGRLLATIAKQGVRPDGQVSGAPTTIFGSATPPEKHVRAAMSGVLGAILQTTRIFGTFDPVQQAPVGGGTVCCILRAEADQTPT